MRATFIMKQKKLMWGWNVHESNMSLMFMDKNLIRKEFGA
jgi:hypothetical protein